MNKRKAEHRVSGKHTKQASVAAGSLYYVSNISKDGVPIWPTDTWEVVATSRREILFRSVQTGETIKLVK